MVGAAAKHQTALSPVVLYYLTKGAKLDPRGVALPYLVLNGYIVFKLRAWTCVKIKGKFLPGADYVYCGIKAGGVSVWIKNICITAVYFLFFALHGGGCVYFCLGQLKLRHIVLSNLDVPVTPKGITLNDANIVMGYGDGGVYGHVPFPVDIARKIKNRFLRIFGGSARVFHPSFP